jgi:ParB family chromosome partitioning protein
LPGPGETEEVSTESASVRSVEVIDIDAIIPNPYQPRQAMDDEALRELSESIRVQGVIQPILLRRIDTRFQLVAGERRWRASKLAGLTTIPAMVVDLTEPEMLEWALVENLQREDLNAIEEARAYQTLIQEFGLSHEEIAQRVGKQRSSVANALRLLRLSEAIQKQIAEGVLTAGHGRALLAVANPARQKQLHERILERGLSVREAEQLAIRWGREPKSVRPEPAADPQLAALADRLSERLGAKTQVRTLGKSKGRLEIYYYNLDDLDRIIEAIMGSEELGL